MEIKVKRTDAQYLEKVINEIKYENILNIIPEHIYDGTLFVIIYKVV
jgi:hypothetical protein